VPISDAPVDGILLDCSVALSSGRIVTVNSGLAIFAGAFVNCPGGNVTVTTSDPSLDRWDSIALANNGTLQLITGTPGLLSAPTNESYQHLASTLLPAGASTITVVDDARVLVAPLSDPHPEQSFAFTYLSGAQSNVDPGAGNFGFDTNNGSVAHAYVNYQSATVPVTGSLKRWLQGGGSGNPVAPWYLRVWSRKDPSSWALLAVSAFADHSTYCDLTLSFVASSSTTVNPFSGLVTDTLDSILEWAGPVAVTYTNGQAVLSGDVTIGTANTFSDAVNTGALAAGTYLISSNLHMLASGGGHVGTSRIYDGTTAFAEGEILLSATTAVQVALCCVITVTAGTTLKLQATSDTGTTDKIKAAVTKNSSGNLATILTWTRIA
jgi:hypothetical protein